MINKVKINRELYKKAISLVNDKIIVLIPTIFILSHLMINIGYQDFGTKNIQILLISIAMTLLSFMFFIFCKTSNDKAIIFLNIKNQIKYVVIFIIIFVAIEIINFKSMYNLRIPIFFVANILMAMLIINFTISKSNVYKFIYIISVMNLLLIIYSSTISLLIRILPNEIHFYNDKVFEHTKFILGIGLRQQRYRTENRFFSIFNNPSHFGELAYHSVLFIQLYKYVTKEEKIRKFNLKFYCLGIASVFLSLINSKARVAVLSILVYLSLEIIINFMSNKEIIISKIKHRNIKLIIALTFPLVLSILYLFKSRGGLDNNGRFRLYKFSFDVFKNNPWFGIGVKEFYEQISNNFNNAHAHNSFLQLLASGGVFFLSCYIFLYNKIFRNLLKIKKQNFNINKIIAAYIASTIFFQLFDNKVLGIHYQFQIILSVFFILNLLVDGELNIK